MENNVIALHPNQEEETFEKFMEDSARKILDITSGDPRMLEHVISTLEDVFDNGLDMGWTMAVEDMKEGINELFEDLGEV